MPGSTNAKLHAMNLARIARSLGSDLQPKPCPALVPIQETGTGFQPGSASGYTPIMAMITLTPIRMTMASGPGTMSFWAPAMAARRRAPNGGDGHRRLHGGGDRLRPCLSLHGAAGRWRAYGDPCRGAGPGGRRLLAGAAPCRQRPLHLRLRQVRRSGGFFQRHRPGHHRAGGGDGIDRAAGHPAQVAIWRRAADRLHRAWRQSGQRLDPEGRSFTATIMAWP